nr:hypothetical transcript [Hymenolepis microstoma]
MAFNGLDIGINELGTICMNALVFTSLVHVALETKYFTFVHAIVYIGSYLILYLGFTVVYNAIGITNLSPNPPYFVIFVLTGDVRFWLCMFVTSTLALLPRILLNATLNTFAPSLDALAARLRRKYGAGQKLPIGRYVEEHDMWQFRRRNANKLWLGDVSGSGGGILEPQNIRSHIASWFTSAGRFLQHMPALHRHIDEPSIVGLRSSSNPELVTHTPPIPDPVIYTQSRDMYRANSYAGNNKSYENSDCTSKGNENVGPYVTEMSRDTFSKSAPTCKPNT